MCYGSDFLNQTLMKIKAMYDRMGRAEKKIADRIIANSDEIISMSVSELSEKCGCGDATVVRFSKRLGFTGYQEMKLAIAREMGKADSTDGITGDDSAFDIFDKVSNEIMCALELTKNALDREQLEKAANTIMGARQVNIYGLGNSASVAVDFQHKLLRAGISASAFCDNHMQAISASHMTPKDVAVGISHSGSSKDIIDALKVARERGATTICFTNHGKSPILKHSDIVLFTASSETKHTILGLNSRIIQLAIVNSIYYYITSRSLDEVDTAIEMTEKALKNKKF